MPELTRGQWEEFLESRPEAHLLQAPDWGELKSNFGWRAHWVAHGRVGAQVLFRPIRLGFTLAYIPKGPIGLDWSSLWPDIDSLCRREKAVFLKVEPDVLEREGEEFARRCLPGFRLSAHAIQPVRTLLVSLEGGEEAVLGRMKQKTRYNIRLAEKKGVIVRPCADLGEFEHLMQATGQRDGFA
ncbi:MAG: peptidoglycan bridge formation glycyltransferase FemA/FemB family protein, partial [Anaerolineaceae bacterium]|nr:peptidoglycan bridge formation glycyltransferase FemA/FemB family protein [Anaerolineaceae bacterium]